MNQLKIFVSSLCSFKFHFKHCHDHLIVLQPNYIVLQLDLKVVVKSMKRTTETSEVILSEH